LSAGNALQRIGQAYLQIRTLANAPGMAYDRDRVKGGESESVGPQGSSDTLADEWAGRLERMAEAIEHELELARNRFANPRWRGGEHREDRDRRILRMYEGREVAFAAWVEGCTPRTIENVRSRNGRRTSDGRPL
jgi:hypothetical protein